jgi:crossover junction endodeoxyribonuclease RuvC
MTIIVGIDPGSTITGYGVIRVEGNRQQYIASGCIRMKEEAIGQRLAEIHNGLRQVMELYQPQEAAIEQVFMHQNPGSAIKLGQARGVAIVAVSLSDISVAEYSARQIKQAVVGYGAAGKEQVQHMVKTLLNLSGTPQADAADALAVALCHAYTRQTMNKIRNQQQKEST